MKQAGNGITTIREGFSNPYLVHSVCLFTLAFIAFAFSGVLALVFVFVAVLLFFTITGVEVNEQLLRYRKYRIIQVF